MMKIQLILFLIVDITLLEAIQVSFTVLHAKQDIMERYIMVPMDLDI